MLREAKKTLYPLLDPPQEDRQTFPRSLTRDRTPNGVDEYVLTTKSTDGAIRALQNNGYTTHEFPTTLKYVIEDGTVVYEVVSLAKGRFSTKKGEAMLHAYAFPAKDSGYHWFHHDEWSLLYPKKHQHGSRTHGDPENKLRSMFQDEKIGYATVSEPAYRI